MSWVCFGPASVIPLVTDFLPQESSFRASGPIRHHFAPQETPRRAIMTPYRHRVLIPSRTTAIARRMQHTGKTLWCPRLQKDGFAVWPRPGTYSHTSWSTGTQTPSSAEVHAAIATSRKLPMRETETTPAGIGPYAATCFSTRGPRGHRPRGCNVRVCTLGRMKRSIS